MSTRAKPEVGGPYQRKLRFEEAVDRDLMKKPLAEPIDRSGLVAINSYQLGYLRDSMEILAQREMEMELHEAVSGTYRIPRDEAVSRCQLCRVSVGERDRCNATKWRRREDNPVVGQLSPPLV